MHSKLPTSLDWNKVKRIARRIRRKIERENEDTDGFCAIASHALVVSLRRIGIRARLANGYFKAGKYYASHCWVELHGIIIDITATQFGQFQKVLTREKYKNDLYKLSSRNPFPRLSYFKRNWPSDQQPNKNTIKQFT